jgi:4-alpha-glucanotransferase
VTRWEELRYRPHVIAAFGGEQIVDVVRDRDLSNAQGSGMRAD